MVIKGIKIVTFDVMKQNKNIYLQKEAKEDAKLTQMTKI